MKNTTIDYLISWNDAFHTDINVVGGKGWNLSRLSRYGFKIPDGCILTAKAYRDFIDFNQIRELLESTSRQIHTENLDAFDNILVRLRGLIIGGTLPPAVVTAIKDALSLYKLTGKSVAVRSSASAEDSGRASFAGIHDSFLNVSGLENIIEAIKGCYASLWTPRAFAYRRKLSINDLEMLPAVVIMEMVNAQSAGVAFSCDPQSGRRDLLVINANFGLGESVVTGSIEPDTYNLGTPVYTVLPEIKSKQIGAKQGLTQTHTGGGVYFEPCGNRSSEQVLNDENIARLGNLITRAFDTLGEGEEHQDIEWAFDGKEIYLLQARPVTALPDYTFKDAKQQQCVWSNGNYRDAVPMVISPLHRRMMKDIIDIIQFTAFATPGYAIPEGFQFSRFFNGRLYCNMSDLFWAYYDCHGMLPGNLTPVWGGHQEDLVIDDQDPFQGTAGLRRQQLGARTMALVTEAAANASDTFAEVIAAIKNITGDGFKNLPDFEFLQKFEALGQIVRSYSEKYCFLSSVGIVPVVMLAQSFVSQLGIRTTRIVNGLMAGGEASITSADHGYRLVELAQLVRQDKDALQYFSNDGFAPLLWEEQLPESSPFKHAFRKFMKVYGHRAIYELDIINPRWQEDPTYLLDIIRSTIHTADLACWRTLQKANFNRAWEEIAALFPNEQLDEIRQAISDAQQGAGVREMNKSILVTILNPYRLLALELGNRFSSRNLISKPSDVFFCTWTEIFSILNGEWDGTGLKTLLEDRRTTHKKNEKLAPPDIIRGEKPVFSKAVINTSGNYLQGIGTAAGKATGIARVINHPGEGNKLSPGEILVAPSTDPGWTPLFLKASAVVMETGGFTSHGSIVAREYGVPAVINIPGVMKAMRDGQTITVDGDEGRVYIGLDSI